MYYFNAYNEHTSFLHAIFFAWSALWKKWFLTNFVRNDIVSICRKLRVVNLPLVTNDHRERTSHFVAQSGFITGKTPAFIECSRPSSKLNERFAPAWPPFGCFIVYIVASYGCILSVWDILIAFAVRKTRRILSKFCFRRILARIYNL